MSERLPLFVVRDLVTAAGSPFTATERLVALCIADHMGKSAKGWPSRRTIGAWTGLGHTAVHRAVRALCEGLHAIFRLELGGARPGGRYKSNVYELRPAVELAARRHPAATRPAGLKVSPDGSLPRGGREGASTRTRGGRQGAREGLIEGLIEGPNQNGRTSTPLHGPLDVLIDDLTEASGFDRAVKARR